MASHFILPIIMQYHSNLKRTQVFSLIISKYPGFRAFCLQSWRILVDSVGTGGTRSALVYTATEMWF